MTHALLSEAPAVVGTGPLVVAAVVAAAAGLVSFLSPCVLPLVPGYLSYVTGLSGAELAGSSQRVSTDGMAWRAPGRRRLLAGSLLFVLGFTAVFVSYGAAFGGVGRQLLLHREAVDQVLGTVTIGLGLVFAGVLARIPWLQREWRFHRLPSAGLVGAPMLGVLFGVGWSPCIGPTLGVVNGLALESGTAGRGAFLSFAYCIGLGVPFVLIGLGFRKALGAIDVVKRNYQAVMITGGGMLVVLGVLEVTGVWYDVLVGLQSWFGSFQSPL